MSALFIKVNVPTQYPHEAFLVNVVLPFLPPLFKLYFIFFLRKL